MLSVFYHILTYIQFLQNTSLTYTILHTYAHTDLKQNLNLVQDTEKAPHHRRIGRVLFCERRSMRIFIILR
jgi:hypothetical protein